MSIIFVWFNGVSRSLVANLIRSKKRVRWKNVDKSIRGYRGYNCSDDLAVGEPKLQVGVMDVKFFWRPEIFA